MIWLWRDTKDPVRMAAHAEGTFWFVLPSLPMFLLIPWMLRLGWPFWMALLAGDARDHRRPLCGDDPDRTEIWAAALIPFGRAMADKPRAV
jgi:hypothetical protein